MKKYNRSLVASESTFSDIISFFNNDIEYRILNGISQCRINKEKIESFICDINIQKDRIKKERISLESYKNTYLETYPKVDPENPYEFSQGMINRLSSTLATLFKSAIMLTPNYRQRYADNTIKKEIWNESVLFANEFQLSMFTDEYPDYVKEFVSVVVKLILLINETLVFCNLVLQEEKERSENVNLSKQLYEEELEDCLTSLELISNLDFSREDVMGNLLLEYKEKGYGKGYHNPLVTKPQMMYHAACVRKQRAEQYGFELTADENILFRGDIEKVLAVRSILNNITIVKTHHKTTSNILAVIFLEYVVSSRNNKCLFVQYANTFLPETDKVNPGSIYRPTKSMITKLRNEIKSAFDEILKTKLQNQAS